MKDFKVGDIVRVKMIKNYHNHHWNSEEGVIPIGTTGKVTGLDNDRLHRIEAIFYVKKVDINKNKWKDFRKKQEYLFQKIYKIVHHFHKKELTRANEKEIKWFNELEENYLSIQLAERI
jgi:hypothetical protein